MDRTSWSAGSRFDAFLNSTTPVILILLAFTLTRLVLLTRLPIFVDEVVHILRARDTFPDNVYVGFSDNKWFYSYLLAYFFPHGPESLWLGRALSALMSAITCAGCVALGRMFDSPRTGLLAGTLYTVLPYAIFHDRQALVEPMMAGFATLALAASVRMARRPRLPYALAVIGSISAAHLTKPLALPYYVIPLTAALILSREGTVRVRAVLLALASTVLAALVAISVQGMARRAGQEVWSAVRPSAGMFDTYFGIGLSEGLQKLGGELAQYWETLWLYFGPLLIAFVLLSLLLIWRGEKRRALIFLWLPAVVFAAPPVLGERPTTFLPARYLATTAAPFVVLAALSVVGLIRWLAQAIPGEPKNRARWLTLTAGLLLIALPLPHDWTIVTQPEDARLQRMDRWQYVTGEVSGTGRSQAGEYLVEAWKQNDQERIAVVVAGPVDQIAVYMGPRAAIFRSWEDFQKNPDESAIWLAQGRPVYFVDETDEAILPKNPFGAITEQVTAYPTGVGGRVRVFRVVGVDDALREEVFHHLFIQPDDPRVSGEYSALAEALAADPTPRAVIVYPPNQLEALQARLADQAHLTVQAIGDQWPLDPDSVSQELDEATQGQEVVEVVFLQETLGDPTRSIEGWLADNLFWEGETWFGPLRLVSYLNAPGEVALSPVAADFGDAITLEAAAIADDSVAPGAGLCVTLLWRAAAPVERSYTVFAHLIDAEGELVAQHDGVPRGGLSPTDTWSVDEKPVSDRFVIVVPGDAPPGAYDLRIGLYDPETGVRLPLAQGADAVSIGQVAVR